MGTQLQAEFGITSGRFDGSMSTQDILRARGAVCRLKLLRTVNKDRFRKMELPSYTEATSTPAYTLEW